MLEMSFFSIHPKGIVDVSEITSLTGQIYKQYVDNQSSIHKPLLTRHTKVLWPKREVDFSLHHHMNLGHLDQVPLPPLFYFQYLYPHF